MYSEDIDKIQEGFNTYANDLKHIVVKICKKLARIGKTDTVCVSYYTDGEVQPWYFATEDFRGNVNNVYIDYIEDLDSTYPTFVMRAETGGYSDDFTMDDFTPWDILGVARLLNDILNVAKEDGEVISD